MNATASSTSAATAARATNPAAIAGTGATIKPIADSKNLSQLQRHLSLPTHREIVRKCQGLVSLSPRFCHHAKPGIFALAGPHYS
jgi:hypothetical protein